MALKVYIACPNKGSIDAHTVLWLSHAIAQLSNSLVVDCLPSPYPLQQVRSMQRERFLKSDCTHMFLLDSGKVPQDHTIQKLLEHDKDIVAAPHPTRIGYEVGPMVLDRVGSEYMQHYPWKGMQGPNVVVGCGGMLIKREVLEKVGPFFCRYDDAGYVIKTEDFDYCDRAHKLGFEVWADFNLIQEHF